jgi:hypothetical protein
MRPFLLAASLLLAASSAVAKPTVIAVYAPKHVLFVGNSYSLYNNGIYTHVREFARAGDAEAAKSQIFRLTAISAANLKDQAGAITAMLKQNKWDVVVLQGNSSEPLPEDKARVESFRESARRYDKEIREAGGRTAFFMTWAYQDKPDMIAPVREAYESIGNELGALVVPVGLAFARSIKERPAVVLHVKDKQHPALAGTYLAAATLYAALYGKSPVGSPYTADLDPEVAKYLQGVAWETVKEYYGR